MLYNRSFHSNQFETKFLFPFLLIFYLDIMYLLWTYILDSCIHGIERNQVICWRLTLGQRKVAHRSSVGPTCLLNVDPTLWANVEPHVRPTKGRWANLRWPNVKRQRWPNVFSVGGPTLAKRSHAILVFISKNVFNVKQLLFNINVIVPDITT